MNLDDRICYCFRITRRKLVNYTRMHELRVASQLSECGGAGTGCGWCIPLLKQLFEQTAGESTTLDQLSAEECEQLRAEHIRSGKGVPPEGTR